MKKIKTIDLIIYGCLGIMVIFVLVFLAAASNSSIDHCCSPMPPEPNYSVITNATDSDPILDQWVRPNERMIQMPFVIFYRSGYIAKGKGHERSIVMGNWTKISRGEYYVQWYGERNDNFVITNWSGSVTEIITYRSSPESIQDSSGSYVRYNVTMDNNPSYNK